MDMKRTRKGFTLIELLVVMAIFSILLVGVIRVASPVDNMYKSTSLSEKTYNMSNNIDVYINSKLEYAEGCWVYTSDKLANGGSNDDLLAVVNEYKDHFYKYAVVYNTAAGAPTVAKGNIYIMRLVNNDANGSGIDPGQITLRKIDFTAETESAVNPVSALPAEETQLNPTYFTGSDAQYNIAYALGKSNVIKASTSLDSLYSFNALRADYLDGNKGISSFRDLAVTVGIEKKPNSTETANGVTQFMSNTNDPSNVHNFRAFKSPNSISVIGIPLMNIGFTNGKASPHYYNMPSPTPGGTSTIKISDGKQLVAPTAYKDTNTSTDMNFENDIYFIFSYADELHS